MITLNEIKKIPQILENPIMVLKSKNKRSSSRNTRVVVFGTYKAQDGMPIMSVLDLRPVENGFVIDDMQKVTSAYTKTTDPVGFVRDSEVLYADKKKTAKLLRTIGFQMPIELNKSGFIGSISYRGQNVNIKGEKFSKIFLEVTAKRSIDTDNASDMANVTEELRKKAIKHRDGENATDEAKKAADAFLYRHSKALHQHSPSIFSE